MSLAPSSPRLPSPPPAAEIQIGPKSPSMANTAANRQAQALEQTVIDANAKRRIHPGTKAADMAAGPPIVPLNELDSAFQLQEHLAALHYYHTACNTQPMTRSNSLNLAKEPPSTDRTLWLYELCRFLISQCNQLIVGFLFDTPPCSASTCPEMRASEWQFLCAVHEQPKSCCAIDYCCHTLDWAANVVTNPKLFPSRFVVYQDSHDKGAAVKALINVFRRLHRIFAHAWFQHRGVFWSVEGQSGLYVLFKTVCDMYELLPAENYKLPPEAEGLEGQATAQAAAAQKEEEKTQAQQQITILARPPAQRGDSGVLAQDDENYAHMNRNNTRRHIRSSPSTGSAVTTVLEADEDEGAGRRARVHELRVAAPETVLEEGPEVVDVPVIVEPGVVPDGKFGGSEAPAPESSDEEADDETVLETRSEDGETSGEADAEAEAEAEAGSESESESEAQVEAADAVPTTDASVMDVARAAAPSAHSTAPDATSDPVTSASGPDTTLDAAPPRPGDVSKDDPSQDNRPKADLEKDEDSTDDDEEDESGSGDGKTGGGKMGDDKPE